jgi:hypothetical protein
VLCKLGEVVRNAILDVQDTELVELQDQEGGHAFRCRVEHERRVESDRRLRGARRVVGIVSARVADRTVQNDTTFAPNTDLQRGVKTASVQRLHPMPKPLDRLGRDAAVARIRLFATDGRGLEISGQAAETAERAKGLLHFGHDDTLAPSGRGLPGVRRLRLGESGAGSLGLSGGGLSEQLMPPKPTVAPDLYQLERAHPREGRLEVADDVVGAISIFFGVDPCEQQAARLEAPP